MLYELLVGDPRDCWNRIILNYLLVVFVHKREWVDTDRTHKTKYSTTIIELAQSRKWMTKTET